MTENINSLTVDPVIEVNFSWLPSFSYSYTYSIDGAPVTSTAPGAFVNTATVFTATTTIDNDPSGTLSIVEWRWDFGDGTQGYGNGATHTYKLDNLQAFTVLRVQDNRGRYWYARKQMYVS